MNIQNTITDVKSQTQQLTARSQQVVQVSLSSLKQANQIVGKRSRSLFDTHKATSQQLLESTRAGFEKARADGFSAVISSPAGYLPPRDKLSSILADTLQAFTLTRQDLVKLVKDGYESATGKSTVKQVKKTAKTAARKTSKTTRKTAASAKKTSTAVAKKAADSAKA